MPFLNTTTNFQEPLEPEQANDLNILYYNLIINTHQTLNKTI